MSFQRRGPAGLWMYKMHVLRDILQQIVLEIFIMKLGDAYLKC